jgi:hypothetical protein
MASFIACPLRFRDAFLRRTGEDEAVLQLLRVMALTPHGSWAACPHFGIRDLFEQARMRPELPQIAVQEANLALQDLGITNYRVAAIAKEGPANRDTDSYVVTIAAVAPGAAPLTLRI